MLGSAAAMPQFPYLPKGRSDALLPWQSTWTALFAKNVPVITQLTLPSLARENFGMFYSPEQSCRSLREKRAQLSLQTSLSVCLHQPVFSCFFSPQPRDRYLKRS